MAGSGRPPLFGALASRRLTWWPEIGVGYFPVEAGTTPYDRAYFEEFVRRADTDTGRALMRARVEFVAKYWTAALVDVGIGSGAFLEARNAAGHGPTLGYDVNPTAVEWLRSRNLYYDPRDNSPLALSFWDSLEHIPDFSRFLCSPLLWVFVCLPVFRDGAHVLASKHYKKDEHCWYFTAAGLIHVMNMLGFVCVETSVVETELGREDIGTFAFRRLS